MANELPEITPITKVKFKIGDDKIYQKTTKTKGSVSPYEDLFSLRITKDIKIDGSLYKNAVVDGMGNIINWGSLATAASVPSKDAPATPSAPTTKAKKTARSTKK